MIRSFWEFRDFVNESGENLIRDWTCRQPKKAQWRLLWLLRNLENTPPPLERKHGIGKLTGECKGLIEVIFKVAGVQYRPLACYGPGKDQITLLLGATKKSAGKKDQTVFNPRNACQVALERKRIICADPDRTVPHDLSTT